MSSYSREWSSNYLEATAPLLRCTRLSASAAGESLPPPGCIYVSCRSKHDFALFWEMALSRSCCSFCSASMFTAICWLRNAVNFSYRSSRTVDTTIIAVTVFTSAFHWRLARRTAMRSRMESVCEFRVVSDVLTHSLATDSPATFAASPAGELPFSESHSPPLCSAESSIVCRSVSLIAKRSPR